ncbi:MAG: hypothetical protein LBF66_00930 [Holosporales bacterium]|nr:hypothetical protein [Holosporales bacterium]
MTVLQNQRYIGLPTDSPGGFLWFCNALNFNKNRRVSRDMYNSFSIPQ